MRHIRHPSQLYFGLLLSLCLSLLCCASVAAEEQILTFHSDITVNEDGSMNVIETIKVLCENVEINHGIYRDFPTEYVGTYLSHKSVPFDVRAVERDGAAEPFHLVRGSNGVRLYIGSRDAYVATGVHRYTLTYHTDRQLGYFADHDELYWNVTGNGWIFPNDAVTADVHLPATVPSSALTFKAYTGYGGQRNRDYTADLLPLSGSVVTPTVHFVVTYPLKAHEGLTVVVGWPKGYTPEPSAVSKLGSFAIDNPGWLILFLACTALPGYYLTAWWLVGRDPKAKTIIPQFAPPQGWTPAAVRYLVHMRYDHRCLAATILNLAANGDIKLKVSHNVYTLERLRNTGGPNLGIEDSVVLANAKKKPLSLGGSYDPAIRSMVVNLETTLENSRRSGFFDRHGLPVAGGVLLSLAGAVGLVAAIANGLELQAGVLFVPYLLIVIPLFAVFVRLLKAYTVKGRLLMDQIEGFKRYLSVAEKDRLEGLTPPEKTPELFEKFLPYALALDVENHWAEQFADVLAKVRGENGQPYQPYGCYGAGNTLFQAAAFSHAMSRMTQNISAGSVRPPPISSGSSGGFGGGGGGFGGGGFSGGGGGGGGGGGW